MVAKASASLACGCPELHCLCRCFQLITRHDNTLMWRQLVDQCSGWPIRPKQANFGCHWQKTRCPCSRFMKRHELVYHSNYQQHFQTVQLWATVTGRGGALVCLHTLMTARTADPLSTLAQVDLDVSTCMVCLTKPGGLFATMAHRG